MVNSIFTTSLDKKNELTIPAEVVNSLSLQEGDKVEVRLQKVKTKRLDIKISRNPLAKLLILKPQGDLK